MSKPSPVKLPDAAAREKIETSLNRNVLVACERPSDCATLATLAKS